MTGISLEARIEDREVLGALLDLVGRMERPEGFHKNVGEHMLNSTRKNFRDQKAPDGTPWKALAPSTVRRRGSASPILTMKGYLRGSINYEVTPQGVSIGTGAVYAAIHQLGGRIEREGAFREVRFARDRKTGQAAVDERGLWRFARRKQSAVSILAVVRAHAITIPARPFLGVSKADEGAILRIARAWLALEEG